MARPRPVPSTFLFLVLSTCWKDSNIFSKSSGFMPMPVSVTEHFNIRRTSLCISKSTVILIWPWLVNLMALFARLIRICLILNASPKSFCGRSGAISRVSTTSLSARRVMSMFETSLNRDMGSYSAGVMVSFPASIFEKSSMSLIMVRRALPEDLIWVM